jgi:hypothetical protein
MRLKVSGVILMAFVFFMTPAAMASVINFDDVDASLGDVSLDAISPYQGLTWTNFFAYTSFPGFDGFNNGIVSSPNAAYSGGEIGGASVVPVTGKIGSASLFDLASIDLGAGYYDDLLITVEGRRAGSLGKR